MWGATDAELYYLKMDEQHRPHELWRHKTKLDGGSAAGGSAAGGSAAGGSAADDARLLHEKDELFWMSLDKSADGKFVLATSESKETSEVHAVDLSTDGGCECVAAREPGVLYSVEHRLGRWLLVTNRGGATNFKLMSAADTCRDAAGWADVGGFGYDDARYVEGVEAFEGHVAVFGREAGLTACWVLEMADGADRVAEGCVHRVSLPEAAYEVGPGKHREYGSTELRLRYSSMVTPPSTLGLDMRQPEALPHTLKEDEVPGYDRSLYATERLEARASDGTPIPVSLVYRRDKWDPKARGPSPMLLYGYGSYGMCMEPSFGATRLPLLDRGMAFAIAHVRGGGEMGREWYEKDGKYLTKRNTFTDFIDVADHLKAQKLTSADNLAITGRSAGGLLVGACLNIGRGSELCAAAVAGVPFVDVMASMCDPTIPLTVGEWEEWGNPNAAKYYEYMRSYSPMENIQQIDYPAILATAGLNDPRVAYWEPTKWVARLRDARTNAAPLLLKMDMDTGHFSASDRYRYIEQIAFEHAFMLDALGLLTPEDMAGAGEEK